MAVCERVESQQGVLVADVRVLGDTVDSADETRELSPIVPASRTGEAALYFAGAFAIDAPTMLPGISASDGDAPESLPGMERGKRFELSTFSLGSWGWGYGRPAMGR